MKDSLERDAAEPEVRLSLAPDAHEHVVDRACLEAAHRPLGETKDVGVVGTAQPAIGDDRQHQDALGRLGHTEHPARRVPGIGGGLGQDLRDALQVGPEPGQPVLGAHDLRSRDQLEGAGDLLRRLDGADAPPQDLLLATGHGSVTLDRDEGVLEGLQRRP